MLAAPVEVQGSVLDWHRARRAQRVPTLTVFVGDAYAAEWYWRRWQGSHETPVVHVAGCTTKDTLGAWLDSKAVRDELSEAFYEQAANAHGASVTELRVRIDAHAPAERERLYEQLSTGMEGWTPTLVAAVLHTTEHALARVVRRGFPGTLAELDGRLRRGLPALLWTASNDLVASAFDGSLSTLVAIAEGVPRVELAIAVTREQLAAWERRAHPRRLALVREGLVRLEPVDAIERALNRRRGERTQ
jgi:hypothetical protein